MPEVPTNPTGLSKPESCAFLCTHFCLPFQKSAQLRKGPRYVELVLVVDNEEVRVSSCFQSYMAAGNWKPTWESLCVLPLVQKIQGLAQGAEPHEGNCEPC